ncbi:MAG: hypothetical protein NTZ17_07445 [Phycisphaerae bacterium]|nr:hypothetical protein [Phycisphaerae bacterium]
MRSFWTTFVLAILVYVGGCEPTPYQRARVTFGHGYADKKFSEDTSHMVFIANYSTPAATLREYLYRRAAELTLQHKFRYFAVIRELRPLAEYQIIFTATARTRKRGSTRRRWSCL